MLGFYSLEFTRDLDEMFRVLGLLGSALAIFAIEALSIDVFSRVYLILPVCNLYRQWRPMANSLTLACGRMEWLRYYCAITHPSSHCQKPQDTLNNSREIHLRASSTEGLAAPRLSVPIRKGPVKSGTEDTARN